MKKKLLHTPEGVRDIYGRECRRKSAVEESLKHVLELYGYQEIETPSFEFFDIFNSDTGTVSSREMYKFFDRNNNTLVLRPDMTPSIARSVAKYYYDCEFPLRLSYKGNTFRNNQSYHGKLAEKTELGAELINDDSPEADAECVVMMIDSFLAAGLTDFQVVIGQAEFFKGLMDALDLDDADKAQIHEYIDNKNALGMEMFLDGFDLPEDSRKLLLDYHELYGDVAMLDHAGSLTKNSRCLGAIERLKDVYRVICSYGYERYVSFDLSMVNYFDYYTGIIFSGYTYGTGDAIGKGGRYDNLLVQFGKNAPACGFTILVDDLLSALSRQNISLQRKDRGYLLLVSSRSDSADAIALLSDFRKGGRKTEWMKMTGDKEIGDYIAFAAAQGADRICSLEEAVITVYDPSGKILERCGLEEFRRNN